MKNKTIAKFYDEIFSAYIDFPKSNLIKPNDIQREIFKTQLKKHQWQLKIINPPTDPMFWIKLGIPRRHNPLKIYSHPDKKEGELFFLTKSTAHINVRSSGQSSFKSLLSYIELQDNYRKIRFHQTNVTELVWFHQ